MRLRYLLLIALVAYLVTGIARVGPEERAVVRRFGEVVARPGPGLWVGLPWGIDRIDRVAVRTVRQVNVGYDVDDEASPNGLLLTGDQNLINVKLVLEYAVDERDGGIDDYLAAKDRRDAVIIREAESLAAEWVGGRPVDTVLLTGRAELPRWIMNRLPERLATHRLGILVPRASVDHLAAPAEVRDAFEAVNQAQTAIRTQEYQAQQEADRRRQQAAAFHYQMTQQAEAYRQEKRSLAAADAESFLKRLTQYQSARATNPNALAAIWWDEMGRTLMGLKSRGRIDLLDPYLGKDGLDITQFVPPKKR